MQCVQLMYINGSKSKTNAFYSLVIYFYFQMRSPWTDLENVHGSAGVSHVQLEHVLDPKQLSISFPVTGNSFEIPPGILCTYHHTV